jgi:geranylgeranyl diphosphate synthase type II
MIKAYQFLHKYEGVNASLVHRLFDQTALEVCEGQQYDMEFEEMKQVGEDQYLKMIELKTAVLLACSLKMGALIGNAPGNEAEALYSFGKYLGLAFQLQDDYLDAFGDSEVFGKKIGGDIVENKKTFLLIQALRKADKGQKEKLNYLLEKETDEVRKIKGVIEIYNDLKIPQITEDLIREYYDEALKAFNSLNKTENEKKNLRYVAGKLMNRIH